MLNYDIGITIGLHIHEFDEMKEPEVAEFRRHILEICQESVAKRQENGKESQALYAYPPETENSAQLPPSMEGKLDKGHIKIAIWSLSQVRVLMRVVQANGHHYFFYCEIMFYFIRPTLFIAT